MTFSSKLYILLLVAGAFHFSTAQTPDYCDPALCWGHIGVHVACNATGQFASTCSASARIVPVTDSLKTIFIKTHNDYRNRAARGIGSLLPATRMATMQWDNELAHLAEIRSRRCDGAYDKCRSTSTLLFAGQNIARTGFSNPNLDNINVTNIIAQQMENWFSQYESATMGHVNAYENVTPIVGAFTAMIQEKANKIGCAIMQHNLEDGRAQMVTTCNYAYINVVGRPVYAPGTAASQCTFGTNVAFDSLCKVAEVYNVNEVPGYDNGLTTRVIINN